MPYKGFKTADGDILLGGGNDRLFGVLCKRLGRPEWAEDSRFVTNNVRVKHRAELEDMIESLTRKKTTQQWLEILEGSGMPYAAINDVKSTLEHEHCKTYASNEDCDPANVMMQRKHVTWLQKSITRPAVLSSWSTRR